MKDNTSTSVGMSLIALASLGLSACASNQGPRPVANVSTAVTGSQVVARGPVPADDASMKVKSSSQRVASASSKASASGQTISEKSSQVISAEAPAAAKRPATEETTTESTETTTVVGSSAVAAPDSDVRMTNQ